MYGAQKKEKMYGGKRKQTVALCHSVFLDIDESSFGGFGYHIIFIVLFRNCAVFFSMFYSNSGYVEFRMAIVAYWEG